MLFAAMLLVAGAAYGRGPVVAAVGSTASLTYEKVVEAPCCIVGVGFCCVAEADIEFAAELAEVNVAALLP